MLKCRHSFIVSKTEKREQKEKEVTRDILSLFSRCLLFGLFVLFCFNCCRLHPPNHVTFRQPWSICDTIWSFAPRKCAE